MVPPPPGRAGLLLLFCLAVGVAEAAPVATTPTDEPDAELLDFLGSWQDEAGRWIDPFTITNDHAAQPPVDEKPKRAGIHADTHKPARETPSPPPKDGPRDPMRMQTGP